MILAVDIGGTKIAAARVTTDGHLASDIAQLPTPAQDGPAAVMRAVEAVVRELGDAGQVGHEVQAIGVSAAGVIDSERGMVLAATSSIAGWAGTPIARTLRDTFGVPISVINDGNAFALGESRFGAGRGLGDVLLLAVGTERQFRNLCEVLHMEYLFENPDFQTNKARVTNRTALNELLSVAISTRFFDDLIERLHGAKVPAARIRDMRSVFGMPEAQAMILKEPAPDGSETMRMRTVAFDCSFS